MVALSDFDKSRCRFHLGYGSLSGIPDEDVARLEEAMETIFDFYQASRVHELLDGLDDLYSKTANGAGAPSYKELIAGDINRSVQRSVDPQQARKLAWENYLAETDKLAHQLWVANYWREEHLRYRYERSGGSFINLLKGVADTSVGATIAIQTAGAVGFGLPAM